MPAHSLTESLDNLYVTTWQHMKKTAIDNIFDATPFWMWLRSKGKLVEKVGGRRITETLEYAKNDRVKWITKGGVVSLNDQELLTLAYYEWRYLVAPLVRFGVDDHQNRGKTKIMDLMNAKLNNAKNSLTDELETRLFAGDGASANAISGLQHLVQDDPTSSTEVGGINQSTHLWWRNKTDSLSGSSFATNGVDAMRSMYNTVSQNRQQDTPDIILTGQTVFEYYEDTILDKLHIENKKFADLGFNSLSFKGVPVVWSPSCGLRMYFLNTRFLSACYDPGLFFDMTEWKPIPEQVNDKAAQIISALQLTTNRRRVHGVIHTIDTA